MSASEHPPQVCRDCGNPFPYDPDADRCPPCVEASLDDDSTYEEPPMFTVSTFVGGCLRDTAEVETPEAALVAARTLRSDAEGAGCARPLVRFFGPDGKLIREVEGAL